MNPGDDYAGGVSRLVLGRICLSLGWHGIHKIPLDIMADMLKLYIQKLGKETLRIAELRNRSQVNLADVEWTVKKNWGSNGGGGGGGWGPEDSLNFMEDYLAVDFNAGSSPLRVPLFPKPAETDLNFLKPGSREVLRRAVYINDYFPPMYPEEEEGDETGDILIDPATDTQSPESSHHGRDLREISSVIMTSAGFISPARQGKLPDARHPPPPPVIQQEKEVIKSEPPPVKTPEPPPVVKEEKIHSDVSNSKKLAIFQKRTKSKPPEETPKHPLPPPAHVPLPPVPVTVKTEPLITPKKEDHIDEVMNSVIEKGIAESKSLSKKKRKRQSAHIFEEKPLFSSPSSAKTIPSSPAPSTTPTKAKKAKNMVTAPLTVLPEPPSNTLKPPPPKLPSPPPPPIVKPPPPTLLPPPPPIVASSNPALFPETPPSKPSKKKDSQPKLVLPPPDLLQMGKHEDRPFSNPLIPRSQLYGFGPPVPEVKEKKKDKEKKKHKKEKNKDKEEKKEKKKNKKDKEKKLLLESSSNLLMPDKVLPSNHPPKIAAEPSSSNSSHPKIKIKEIKHEKNIPSSSSLSSVAAPTSSSSLRLSPTPPSTKESSSSNSGAVGVGSKSSSKSLSSVKPPKLILKPPKDSYDTSSSSSATTASKKPKLDKKDFLSASSSSSLGGGGGGGSVSSSTSKAEKKAKKSTKSSKEEANFGSIADATSSSIGMITTQTVGHYVDAEGNQIWICPACGKQDDGSPMIGCDKCDDWYHWACVGISAEPAENQDWFCTRCMAKKTNFLDKKGKKKH